MYSVPSENLQEEMKVLANEVIGPRGEDHPTFRLTVRRTHALTDALELMDFTPGQHLFRPLQIVFLGESAVDDGGPKS